jgi:hypothetical protein
MGRTDADIHQHVVWPDRGIQKLEEAVLCRFDCGDVAWQAFECWPQVFSGLAKYPPILSVACAIIGVSLRLHCL